VYDLNTKQILAQLVQAQCELARSLTGILDLLYSQRTPACVPTSGASLQKLQGYVTDLDRWYQQMHATFMFASMIPDKHGSLKLYMNIICIYYQ
jgi:hypothetical protein